MSRHFHRRQELPSIDALKTFGFGVLAPGGFCVALAALLAVILR